MRQGRLYVSCLKAELTKDHDLTGKMDPFVRVTVGKVSKQTKSHEEGGLKPVWNQELEFEVNGTEEFMEVEVLDDDGGGKFDFVGKDSFDFGTLVSNPLKDLQFKLFLRNKGNQAGVIYLKGRFKPVKALKVRITVEKAELKTDHDFFNKMDPFVIINVGTLTRRTTAKDEAGKLPVWNQTFEFDIVSEDPLIEFIIRDDDGDNGAKYDECGKSEVRYSALKAMGEKVQLPVKLNGSDEGMLFFSWKMV